MTLTLGDRGAETRSATNPLKTVDQVVLASALVIGSLWGFARSFWLDEAYSLAVLHDPVTSIVSDRGSMVLYHGILAPLSWISEAPWFLRLPSLAFGVAAVVLVARLAAADFGRWAGLFAGAAMVTSWTVVSHSQEMRAYSLALLIGVAQWMLLERWLRRDDQRAWKWWFALAFLGTFVQGLVILLVIAQGLTVEIAGFDRVTRRWSRIVVAVSALPAAVLALGGAATLTKYQPALSAMNVQTVVEDLLGAPNPIGLPMLILAILGTVALVKQLRTAESPVERFIAARPVMWAVAPLFGLCAISIITPKLVPRYVFPSVAGMAILAAVGLATIKPPRLVAVVAVIALAPLVVHQLEGHQAGTADWKGAAQLVAAEAQPDDLLVFPRANRRQPFEVEWVNIDDAPELAVANPSRPLSEVQWLTEDEPIDEVVATASEHDRVWVVVEPFMSLDRERPMHEGLVNHGYAIEQQWFFGQSTEVYLYTRP